MSLVASRLSLTHTCTIERDITTTSDAWGNPTPPAFQTHLSNVPCRAQVTAGKEVIDATTTVVVDDMRLIVTVGTDVTERDRIASVADRTGTIITGPVGIRAVLRHQDHLELVLVRLD